MRLPQIETTQNFTATSTSTHQQITLVLLKFPIEIFRSFLLSYLVSDENSFTSDLQDWYENTSGDPVTVVLV